MKPYRIPACDMDSPKRSLKRVLFRDEEIKQIIYRKNELEKFIEWEKLK